MSSSEFLVRERCAEADAMFIDRWSPRALNNEPISSEQMEIILEAARWAPSAYNEQPWRFVYSVTEQDRNLFVNTLVEMNQKWASNASVLLFIFAKKTFSHNNAPNRWALFDCGSAWVSIALQARKLGLYSHAMAGFVPEKVYEATGVSPEDYDIAIAVALGKRGDASELPADLLEREKPNGRKMIKELML
ncbi:MAG: nitroreductase family protein [Fibrobacter sp.]|nr:nitroreductase family protein [Fibrobacter sp.]